MAKVRIELLTPLGTQYMDYTIIKEYEYGSILVIPYGDSCLMDQCKSKPTMFSKNQIIKYIND